MKEEVKKKKAPHWMDCNCICHGTWGEDLETLGKTCPHCRPEMFPNYEVDAEERVLTEEEEYEIGKY